MLFQEGIRACSELQIVALFLPGRFMRRSLSPLVAKVFFVVVPHWLSGYLPACFVPKSCICGESKGWIERKVRDQFKNTTPKNHLIFCPNLCQHCPLHSGGTPALLSQTPCLSWDGAQMTLFTVISTGISLYALSRYAMSVRAEGMSSSHAVCEEARAEGNKASCCTINMEHKIQLWDTCLSLLQYSDRVRFLFI